MPDEISRNTDIPGKENPRRRERFFTSNMTEEGMLCDNFQFAFGVDFMYFGTL